MNNKTYTKIIESTKKSKNQLLKEISQEFCKLLSKRKIRKDCKCDCGHTKAQHSLGEGQCIQCGCTWFYPCIARVEKNIAKKERIK